MFISCGAQTCLHSCWGFLPHLVITHSRAGFLCYCSVQKELDIDFDKVQEKEPETEAPAVPVRHARLLVKGEVMMKCTFEIQTIFEC